MSDSELVQLAATKVMGWRVYGGYGSLRAAAEDGSRFRLDLGVNGSLLRLWNPLESIADAWMLVEKLANLHFVIGKHGKQHTAWFVDKIWAIGKVQNEVPHQDDPACLGSWTADAAPRAITMAAVKACGVEV